MVLLDEILKKAEYFDGVIQARHSIQGLVLPTVVLPPAGREDYQTGNYENCAIWTGIYVAAQSLRFAVTGDAQAREQAKSGLLALHRLQEVTGESGLIARGYKTGYEQTWDEEFFWKKERDKTRQRDEWHQSTGYRWLGDASKSQVFGVVFGYFTFSEFCNPTKKEREEIGRYLSNVVDRIMSSGLKIIDKDKQVSGYGNYSPKQYLGYGGIGPFLILSKLKLAFQIAGQEGYETEYRRLLGEEDYVRFLKRGRLDAPILRQLLTSSGHEDNLAMLNYYMLMTLETDEELRKLCREGLDKRWNAINDPENSLFNFIYHALMQVKTPALERGVDALLRFPTKKQVHAIALKRKLPKSRIEVVMDTFTPRKIPIELRPIDEYAWRVNPLRHDLWVGGKVGTMEFTGVDFLIATYLGLYHGFIR